MKRKIGNRWYAYASKRIRDPKHPKGYRIVQEYLGPLGSRARKAANKHDELMEDRKDGVLQKRAGNVDLFRYFESYLKSNDFKKLKTPTQNLEKKAIFYFKEFLQDYPHTVVKVHQITPAVVQDYQNWLKVDKEKSGALTNRDVRIIKKLAKSGAKAKEDLTWQDLRSEEEYKGKKNPYQWQEVFALLQIPNFFWYGVACVGMLCGLRRKEFQHLLISDIDIDEWDETSMQDIPEIANGKIVIRKELRKVSRVGGILHVRKKVKTKDNGIVENWTPKKSHARDIAIPDWAAIWLKEAIARAKILGTQYVFNVEGKMMTPDYLTTWFKTQAIIQSEEKATPHRLRHTFGTGIGEIAGAAMILVTMGHSSLKTSAGYMGNRDQQLTIDKLQKVFEERAQK